MKKKKKEKEKEKRKIIYFYDAFGVIGKPTIQSFCNSSLGVRSPADHAMYNSQSSVEFESLTSLSSVTSSSGTFFKGPLVN